VTLTNGALGIVEDGDEGDNHFPECNATNRALTFFLGGARVLDKDLATPPGSPAHGDAYIIAASPTGAWATHAGKLARYNTYDAANAWDIYPVREGIRVWVADEDKLYYYTGSAWAEFAQGGSSTQTGSGSPEGVVTAAVGAFYIQTNASPDSDGVWYKKTGSGNTGWEQVTASDGTGTAGAPSHASVRHNTTQSIPNNASTTVTFDTEVNDTDAYFDTGTPTRFTIPANGTYQWGYSLRFAANATGIRSAFVRLDGTTTVGIAEDQAPTAAGACYIDYVSPPVVYTASQFLELRAFQNSGAGLNLESANPSTPQFWITRVQDTTGNDGAETLTIAASDETTTLTSGTGKVTFRMPYAMVLNAGSAGVRGSLTTVSSSGAVTVDINEGGSTILSTKLTIDQSEKTSLSAATPVVISDVNLADDAEITIDIDGAGTGAAGLKVTLRGTRV
jgi:hypothetical protein